MRFLELSAMRVGSATGLSLAVGCSSLAVVSPESEHSLLKFVPKDGTTTRSEIYRAYGPPHVEYEGGILTYRFTFNGPQKELTVTPSSLVMRDRTSAETAWRHSNYSLVLVFDGDRLRKHSLVLIR